MNNVTRDDIKAAVQEALDEAVDLLCDTIGIPKTDPVETLARECWMAANESDDTHPDINWHNMANLHKEQFRRIARHVLGRGMA